MSHVTFHCESSAKKFGGKPEDYLELHSWFDETKEMFGDFRHRALRHHSHGIYELERKFGVTITNSDGKEVPVRLIGEQHVREDCGNRIPSVQDWLSQIMPQRWMNAGYQRYLENREGGVEEGKLNLYLVQHEDHVGDSEAINFDQFIWAESPTAATAIWADMDWQKEWDQTKPTRVFLIPVDMAPKTPGPLQWHSTVLDVTPKK